MCQVFSTELKHTLTFLHFLWFSVRLLESIAEVTNQMEMITIKETHNRTSVQEEALPWMERQCKVCVPAPSDVLCVSDMQPVVPCVSFSSISSVHSCPPGKKPVPLTSSHSAAGLACWGESDFSASV